MRAFVVSMVGLVALGCSPGIVLTRDGERVTAVEPADVPAECEMVGDVSIGIPPDAARPRTEEQLLMLMRNKAAEAGATHVMVESRERRGQGGDVHYRGRARAYVCPREPTDNVVSASAGAGTGVDTTGE
jgi:hypothetical protein